MRKMLKNDLISLFYNHLAIVTLFTGLPISIIID